MYSVEYLDKYIKVIDKTNNNVVASGKVIATKNKYENNGISFDNKLFFRETERLKFEEVDFVETKVCNPQELGLKHIHIRPKFPDDIDVISDYGYDELDEEIRDYVYKFNELTSTIKTTTSCSGHGRKPWYIEFEFSEFNDMSKFINVVETFQGKLMLVTSCSAGQVIRKKNIHLTLSPTVNDYDFVLLNKFCRKVSIVM